MSCYGPNWNRQDVARASAGAEGLSRWLQRAVPVRCQTVPRPCPGAADGSLGRLLESIARTDVLLVDDFAMAALNDDERRSFLEVCDDRYGRRSTVLTSQLPIDSWHAQIGDPTIADSILDRLVHNAYRIEMNGESMRKKKKEAAVELTGGRS